MKVRRAKPFRWGLPVMAGTAMLFLAAWAGGRVIQERIRGGVTLVFDAQDIQPTSTFELRSEQPLIPADEVGRVASRSPLVIEPPLPGKFMWLSRRSGVFSSSEPLAMATRYRIRLRQGLRWADGQPLHATLERDFETPSLEVVQAAPSNLPTTNAAARPLIRLDFNADVRASAVARFIRFQSPHAGTVPARVEQATRKLLRNHFWRPVPLTWQARFQRGRPSALPALPHPNPETTPEVTYSNVLLILPAQPLPVGRDWELVLDHGLPSTHARVHLGKAYHLRIGDVQPFVVLRATAENALNAGRRLVLHFSKSLARDVTMTNVDQWVHVEPAPKNLKPDIQGDTLSLSGAFDLGRIYSVRVAAGLPAAQPFRLAQTFTTNIEFSPLPPRLYFPAFSTEQAAGGQRKFPLLVVNAGKVQLRAKLIDTDALIHALRGFKSYYRPWDATNRWLEPYQPLDYNLLPGHTIFSADRRLSLEPDQLKELWLKWDKVLGGARYGPVFLEADFATNTAHGPVRVGTQALVQLTDLGLLAKFTPTTCWVHVFSDATGRPVAGAQVRLLTEENQLLAEGASDADGVVRLQGATGKAWLEAVHGGDVHATRLADNTVYVSPSEIPFNWQHNTNTLRALWFSDRPLYRPGETVHLKAIVRDCHSNRMVVPAGHQAFVSVVDSRNHVCFKTNQTLSALGSLAVAVVLPAGPRGTYRAELRLGSKTFSHSFLVQDYRPNAFAVDLNARATYAPGVPVAIGLKAHYLLGQPVSHAQVAWSVEGEDAGFEPSGFDDFQFCTSIWLPKLGLQPGTLSLAGKVSYHTGLQLKPALALNPQAPQPRRFTLLAEVTDLNQQTVSQAARFLVQSSDFYLGVRRSARLLQAGQAFPLELIAVAADGRPWGQPVRAQVTLSRVIWRTVRLESAGGIMSYESQPEVHEVARREVQTVPLGRVGPHWLPQPPAGKLPHLTLPEPGMYLLKAQTHDDAGRPVQTAFLMYVYGAGQLAWNYRRDNLVKLLPDRTSYRPGETARLLVETPISGEALVTVERQRVRRWYRTNVVGNAPVVRVPIEPGDAPNVFVSVAILRGADASPRKYKEPAYGVGYAQLNVASPGSKLQVAVQSNATDYEPGATVKVTTTVRDAKGTFVPDAEVTLFAEDEGVLSLTGFQTPDPHAAFFAPYPLNVQTAITLPQLLPEDPGALNFGNKGYLVGGGGRYALRRHFATLAYWNAHLMTDAAGRVTATFRAPDSLTRFRVMAVVQTAQSQFGNGECAFRVNKPLMLEPALPAFANVGDRLLARAVVLNRTADAGEAEVWLELDHKAKLAPAADGTAALTNRVQLMPHGEAAVDIPVKFVHVGQAKWRWHVRVLAVRNGVAARSAGAAEDASQTLVGARDDVQSTLRVDFPVPALSEVHLVRLAHGATNLLQDVNPEILEGAGTVQVHLATTRLGELSAAVRHLVRYPYGCIEQTTSKLLGFLAARAEPALRETNNDSTNLEALIQAALDRILSMQTQSGGMSYWPGDGEAQLWGSAYAGVGLAFAQRRGWTVPKSSLTALTHYLHAELANTATLIDPAALSTRCLAVYALALLGRPEAAYQEVLFEKRAQLPGQARAWLALAVLANHGADSLVAGLLDPNLPGVESAQDWFWSPSSDLGTRLLAWVKWHPNAPTVDVLVAELTRSQQDGHWQTTQGDAWALLGLEAYAHAVEPNPGPVAGSLVVNGQAIPFRLASRQSAFVRRFAFGPGKPALSLVLRTDSERPLFGQITARAQPRITTAPRQDRGLLIERHYARLDIHNQPHPAQALHVGDRVLVTLTLEVRRASHFVAVDDPLPAVLQAVNPEFVSQESHGSTLTQDWVSSHRELRSDRALFFCNALWPGRYTIRYLARVRAAGDVTAPAAEIEEMYHPERFGLTATTHLRALPAQGSR